MIESNIFESLSKTYAKVNGLKTQNEIDKWWNESQKKDLDGHQQLNTINKSPNSVNLTVYPWTMTHRLIVLVLSTFLSNIIKSAAFVDQWSNDVWLFKIFICQRGTLFSFHY